MYDYRKGFALLSAAAILATYPILSPPVYAQSRVRASDGTIQVMHNGKNLNLSQYLDQISRKIDYEAKKKEARSRGYKPSHSIRLDYRDGTLQSGIDGRNRNITHDIQSKSRKLKQDLFKLEQRLRGRGYIK